MSTKIQLSADRCGFCEMVVGDVKYAGIYYSMAEMRWKKFDDRGCMAMGAEKKGYVKKGTMYVFDYETRERIKAKKAYYVVSSKIWTPMNTGILAFENESIAQKFAGKYGVGIASFDELMKMKVSMGNIVYGWYG